MSIATAYPVKRVAWKATDDKKFALVEIEQQGLPPMVLAFPEQGLVEIIASLIGALGVFEVPKMTGKGVVVHTDWLEVGKKADGMVVVSFRTQNGGKLGFQMDQTMAGRLAESLPLALGDASKVQKPDTPAN